MLCWVFTSRYLLLKHVWFHPVQVLRYCVRVQRRVLPLAPGTCFVGRCRRKQPQEEADAAVAFPSLRPWPWLCTALSHAPDGCLCERGPCASLGICTAAVSSAVRCLIWIVRQISALLLIFSLCYGPKPVQTCEILSQMRIIFGVRVLKYQSTLEHFM